MEDKKIFEKLLGVTDFNDYEDYANREIYLCRFYHLRLPAIFKAIPQKWDAIILTEQVESLEANEIHRFIVKLTTFLKQISINSPPLIVISTYAKIRLSDKLSNLRDKKIFLVDKFDLEGAHAKTIRDIPLVKIIRSKLTVKELELFFTPYHPKTPAEGWRFFGRKRELQIVTESPSNFLIVGARQIGKTSILKELRLLLQEKGQTVYFIDLQASQSSEEVIAKIIGHLDPRELHQIQRQYLVKYPATSFEAVLKRLVIKSRQGKIYLFLDELGNVINANRRNDWSIIGVLRKLSSDGQIQIVATGFQEFFVRQTEDFEGPLVNFARVIKLSVLSAGELEDFIITPLSIWGDISEPTKTLDYIERNFGTHPLILQYLGSFLFNEIFSGDTDNVLALAQRMFERPTTIKEVFEEPVRELFILMKSPVCKYLYLKFCITSDKNGKSLSKAILDDTWIEQELNEMGLKYTYEKRRLLCEEMELRGLLCVHNNNSFQFKIASPIIYGYLKKYWNPLEQLMSNYLKEVKSTYNNDIEKEK